MNAAADATAPARVPVVRTEHLTRTYRLGAAEVRAVDDVSLVLAPGEMVAMMGPSGSGKSTLLHLLGGLDVPTSGRYWFEGEPIEGLGEDRLAEVRARGIGFVFQTYHLVGRMSAVRNVELPMIFAGVPPAERRRRAVEALAAVGLSARAAHRPDQLSGGERQRVAIARAVVMRPRLLLADEPTGNLDTRAGREIVALLQRLHDEGLTVVIVTHDPRVGAAAERRIGMHDGRIVSDVRAPHLAAAEAMP